MKAVVHVAETLKGARETSLLENEISEMTIQERTIEVPIFKHEIKTIKILARA